MALGGSKQDLHGPGCQKGRQATFCCSSTGCFTCQGRDLGPGAGRQLQAPASGQAVRKVSKQAVDCSGLMPCWRCMTAAALALT